MKRTILGIVVAMLVIGIPTMAFGALAPAEKPTYEETCKGEWERCRGAVTDGIYRGKLGVIEAWNEYNRCDFNYAVCITPFVGYFK